MDREYTMTSTLMRKYYEQAYDPSHELHQQLRPALPYAENSLWSYYASRLKMTIEQYNLKNTKALEIGCGTGFLQDLINDYTGIDLASTSSQFVHKPFVTGSAMELPFADNTFDIVWCIWVLEHIPDPERMLSEIRRVTKPNGLLFLCAAWNVPTWVSAGYDVRPFTDFNWRGKLIKATVVPRTTKMYRLFITLIERILRTIWFYWISPMPKMTFRRLRPNLQHYWSNDSDAVISIDAHTIWLWLRAQGDLSLDQASSLRALLIRHSEPLRFRIKPGSN